MAETLQITNLSLMIKKLLKLAEIPKISMERQGYILPELFGLEIFVRNGCCISSQWTNNKLMIRNAVWGYLSQMEKKYLMRYLDPTPEFNSSQLSGKHRVKTA
jgi:hypothetical protein